MEVHGAGNDAILDGIYIAHDELEHQEEGNTREKRKGSLDFETVEVRKHRPV